MFSMKKKRLFQTLGYFGSFFILGSVLSLLGPTLPDLAENVQVSISAVSILFSARSLGYLSGSLLGGVLYDRFPGHTVLGGFLILDALALVLVPQSYLFALLVGWTFLLGLTLGGMDVGSNTLLTDAHGEEGSVFLNAMYFFAGVGSFLTPLYLAQVPLTWGYWGLVLPAAGVALWLLRVPSPVHSGAGDEQDQEVPPLLILILFALLSFLIVGIEVSYGGWVFTYVQEGPVGSTQMAYTLTSVFWLSITAGRLLSIPFAARVRSRPMIYTYLGGGMLSAALMVLFPRQTWAVWLGTVGVGLSLSASFPTAFHFVKSRITLRGKYTGVVWSVGSLGAVTLPWLIGQWMTNFGLNWLMYTLLAAWTLGLLLFGFLSRSVARA